MNKSAPYLLIALLALGSCGEAPPVGNSGPPVDARVFHRSSLGDPGTLDPHRNEENNGSTILRDLFEGLITEAADGTLEPGVAERWSISDDGRTYRFALRANARWSNGDAVTADDFVAGLQRTTDPHTASSYAGILYPIRNAEAVTNGELAADRLGVRAIDAHTLEIELNRPTPYFLQLLTLAATYPLHRPSYDAYGDQFARAGRLVSNGAYRLTEWVVSSHVRLDKNEFYSGAAGVAIDTVYYHSIEDKDSELRRYRAGELDYTDEIPNSQYAWIKDNLADELHVAPYMSVYFYGFDTTEPPFDDIRLRKALTMAIDRRIITEHVNGIGELAAYGLIPPGVASYEPQRYAWEALSDIDRIAEAKRLYTAAGYSETNPLHTEIRYNTSDNHRRLALAIRSMWKEALGVEAEVVNQEFKVLLQERQDPTKWEVLRYGWTGDYDDPFTFLEIFQHGHAQNFTGIMIPGFDDLLERAAAERDPAQRAGLLADAERSLIEAYPIAPVYFYVSKHLVKPYVKGFRSNILNHAMTRHYRIER